MKTSADLERRPGACSSTRDVVRRESSQPDLDVDSRIGLGRARRYNVERAGRSEQDRMLAREANERRTS
jgi:hypothetical protein